MQKRFDDNKNDITKTQRLVSANRDTYTVKMKILTFYNSH